MKTKEEIEQLADTLVNQTGEIGFRNGVIIGVTKWIEMYAEQFMPKWIEQEKATEAKNYKKHGLLYNNTFYWDFDSIEYDYGMSDRLLPLNWKDNVIEVYSIKDNI